MFYVAAALVLLIGFAHSYLGEKYILMRLFRRNQLPELLGSTEFTKGTLRFAWHITTLAWFGLALILVELASDDVSEQTVGNIIAVTFLVHFLIALVASRGKHFSWIVFLLISAATFWATNA